MSALLVRLLAFTTVLVSVFANTCPTTTSTGSFADTAVPYRTITHPLAPTSYWGNTATPRPTNTFWTNLILTGDMKTIDPLPYIVAVTTSVAVGMPGKSSSATGVMASFVQNMNMGAAQTLNAYTITAFDALSVTPTFTENGGSGTMVVPIVRGNPLMTFVYTNLTPQWTTIHAILSINGNGAQGTYTGTKFKVSLNNGQTWVLYALGGSITLNWANNALTATSRYTGAIRAGVLLSSACESAFDAAYQTYPTGVQMNFYNGSSTENAGYIEFAFQTVGTPSNLLLLALPHHIDVLSSGNTQVLGSTFMSMKGYMTGLTGNIWRLREQFTNVVWGAPAGIPASKKADILAALQGDAGSRGQTLDPYWGGKSLGKMARLALIADELGEVDIANTIRTNMKADIAPWLLATNTDPLLYDSSYGGIVATNGIADAGADYGNGYYNDHHFHYGYFVYAAAAIGKGDPAWLAANKQYIMPLVRDIANPVRDSRFPQARHKDWYDGHSWASGLFSFGDSKNQESSSECINAYYGVYLLGVALNDPTFTFWGQMLMMTEIRSAQKYWHIKSDTQIYDPVYAANKVVGVLWSSKVDYTTFFGANVEYIHGIQMMPYTPISEVLLTADWIAEEYPVVSTALTRTNPVIGDDWKGFILMAHAIIAPNTAWNEVQSLSLYDSGNSKTNVLYWVATRPGFTAKRSGNTVF